MSAIKRRENTFRIDYVNVPKKPSSEEVHQFVGVTLGMKREEVLRIQYSRNTGIAFVKAASLEVAQKVVEENDNQHELTVDGKPYKLRLVMEDGAVAVRLFNLSEDVTNEKIVKLLSGHGEIFSIREEVSDENHYFPGLSTGVRIVRMAIKKGLASYVTIDGETTLVSYNGQQQTCRYCGEYIHNGISCVQNKKLLVQKLAIHSSSYADVAKNPNPLRPTLSKSNPPRPNPLRSGRPRPSGPKQQSQPNNPKSDAQKQLQHTQESTPTNVEQGASGMEIVEIDLDGFLKPATVQQKEDDNTWTRVTRKSGSHQTSDGNETDSSTSSRRSRRPVGKKMRCGDGDDSNDNTSNH